MKWTADVNFENMTSESAKFLFSQSEKKLEDTIKLADAITTRSHTIITLLVGVLLAVSGYFFDKMIGAGVKDIKSTLSLIATIYLLICLFFLLKNVFPKQYNTLGSYPIDLCNKVFFESNKTDKQPIYIYISEMENYQERITYNVNMNERRLIILRNCLLAIYVLPFILFITYYFLIM